MAICVAARRGLIVVAAVVAAVPLGINARAVALQSFAAGIGVIVEPVVPLLALTAAAVGAVVLVQAVALIPAQRARRTVAVTDLAAD